MESELLSFWNRDTERCGYIDLSNKVFELPNIHEDKKNGFELAEIPKEAVAIWHTHPSGCPNLSIEDFHLFSSLPHLLHVIVGIREIAYYFVDTDGSLLRKEENHVPS
jgi:proteasome lid subunit RPN8/RPN11